MKKTAVLLTLLVLVVPGPDAWAPIGGDPPEPHGRPVVSAPTLAEALRLLPVALGRALLPALCMNDEAAEKCLGDHSATCAMLESSVATFTAAEVDDLVSCFEGFGSPRKTSRAVRREPSSCRSFGAGSDPQVIARCCRDGCDLFLP